MKSNLTTLNSDAVNRYGYRFTIGALEDATWQTVPYGIPSSVSHDRHRLIGWINPFGLYFEPGIVKHIGQFLIAEDENDSKQINNAFYTHFIEEQSEYKGKYDKDFLPLIENFSSENKKFIYAGCAAYIDNDIVDKIFPQLASLRNSDKDKLIPVRELLKEFKYHQQGIFFHKKSQLAIFTHSYFRRSLSRLNNYHYFFLDELMSLSANSDLNVKIALDLDMVGYAPSFLENHELEYWYGPSYNDDISAIKPGLTIYKNDDFERQMSGFSDLELEWKIDKNEYTLEAEELRDIPSPMDKDHYGCRYIHSIYKADKKIFNHFDGAIRIYDTELMLERVDTKMTDFGRRSDYNKIFRIDGELKLSDWKSLSTNYFQGNRLIYEYFGINRSDIEYKVEQPKADIAEFVPYSMREGDGVRLLFSYHKGNDSLDEISISRFDELIIGNDKISVIEYDIVEIKKMLKKQGKSLNIPESVKLVQSKDVYWNIPALFHNGNNGNVEAYNTQTLIRKIVAKFIEKQVEKVVSFTLGWNLEGKEARISVVGHIKDLIKWLDFCPSFPNTRKEVKSWLEEQSNYMKKNSGVSPVRPDMYSVAVGDGVIYMKRRNAKFDADVEFYSDEVGLKYNLTINDDKRDIYNMLLEKRLYLAVSYIYNKVICSKTDKEYTDSEYSAIFDEDVYRIIKKMEIVGAHWSDYEPVQ